MTLRQDGRLLFFLAVAFGVLFISTPAIAQDSNDEEAAEEIVVTGSRIRGTPVDGPRPVQVISRADIRATGFSSIGDVLQSIPGQGSGLNTTYNNGGSGAIRVDYRNLGASRTLVLVNGRRYVNGGSGANASVDLSTIPLQLVERIEVLKDGASAVYGSDAIAAVVNIILIDEYEGLEYQVRQRQYAASGGGERADLSAHFGGTYDRGNFLVFAGYESDQALSNADRTETFLGNPSQWSSGTPQGRFAYGSAASVVTGSSCAGGSWTVQEGTSNTWDGTQVDGVATNVTDSTFRCWVAATGDVANTDRFNFNPDNYIETPNDRRSLAARGTFEFSDSIRFNYEANYINRTSEQLLAPTPLFWGFGTDEENENIGATNPYNPTDRRLCGLGESAYTASCYNEDLGNDFNVVRRGTRTEGTGDTASTISFYYIDYNADGAFTAMDDPDTDQVERIEAALTSAQVTALIGVTPTEYFTYEAPAPTTDDADATDTTPVTGAILGANGETTNSLNDAPVYFVDANGDGIPQANEVRAVRLDGGSTFGLRDGQTSTYNPTAHVGWFGRRMVETGFRSFNQDIHLFRTFFEVEGEFAETWQYQAYYSYASTRASGSTDGLLNVTRIGQALGDLDGCQNPCVPLNVFGGQGANSAKVANQGRWTGDGSITNAQFNWISFTAQGTGGSTLENFGVDFNGTVGSLPGGDIGLAVGFERRDESGFQTPDALIATGQSSGNASSPTSGDYQVEAYYGEVNLPIIGGDAFSFTVNAAVRSGDYSTFGKADTYRLNVLFGLIDDRLKVRATFAEGFRAPSIGALFGGTGDSFPDLNDPCDVNAPNYTGTATAQSAACAGVPTGFTQPNSQIRITVGSNANLGAETSESFVVGVSYEPIDDLLFTIDYYSVDIVNSVTTIGAQTILDNCYGTGSTAPGRVADCQFVDRNNAGLVTDLRNILTNGGGTETDGIEFSASYTTPSGFFTTGWDLFLLNSYTVIEIDGTRRQWEGVAFGSGRDNYVDTKINGFINFALGNFDFRANFYYFGEVRGVSSSETEAGRTLSATLYTDFRASYDFQSTDITVTIGVDNVLDQDPPYFPESFANDFDPRYRTWGSQAFWVRGVFRF